MAVWVAPHAQPPEHLEHYGLIIAQIRQKVNQHEFVGHPTKARGTKSSLAQATIAPMWRGAYGLGTTVRAGGGCAPWLAGGVLSDAENRGSGVCAFPEPSSPGF